MVLQKREVFSGISPVDTYLQLGFESVLGMSSRFAAAITAAILDMQARAGLKGDVAEIGVFEGRFLIAMTLAIEKESKAVAVDTWNWPDDGVHMRFMENLRRFGIEEKVHILDAKEAPTNIMARPDVRHRFIHIDADHTYSSLLRDLEVCFGNVDPRGIISIDDMLHPGYPELYDAVRDALKMQRNWQVFCVLDRTNIVAASKFLLCDKRMFNFYVDRLLQMFPQFVWKMGARFSTHVALVLAEDPLLAMVRR